jgi:deoxyribodipyrimidine photo-lyase
MNTQRKHQELSLLLEKSMSKIEVINPNEEIRKVLYIMMNAFRISQNEAIEYAKEYGCFDIIIYHVKEGNERQNNFLLEGISNYNEMDVSFINRIELIDDIDSLLSRLKEYSHIVIDQPYLKEYKNIVRKIYEFNTEKSLILVENQTAVPVKIVSNKEEYSARTIRPKIWSLFHDYHQLYEDYDFFVYEKKARAALNDFIRNALPYYDQKNDPTKSYVSKLSVFLKYGFLSVSYIYEQVSGLPNSELFLEELIVRRELAYNFVFYNKGYDSFNKMTYEWAYKTMEEHLYDPKDTIYDLEDYIHFRTHDPYFNQAMKNMIQTGYMHGYMRMYWCKKIIEWSKNYEEAYRIAIYLNNYYFLDGNTPNGYTGVAWCFGKHDRAWVDRPIFGKLRYMNQNGLKRKFNIEEYIKG